MFANLHEISFGERAHYGARLLDEWFPGWFDRIELNRLDATELGRDGILAQLYGTYQFAIAAIRQLRLDTNREFFYLHGGFMLIAGEKDPDNDLTLAWMDEIVERRLGPKTLTWEEANAKFRIAKLDGRDPMKVTIPDVGNLDHDLYFVVDWKTNVELSDEVSLDEAQRRLKHALDAGCNAMITHKAKREHFAVVDRRWSMGKTCEEIKVMLRKAASQAHIYDPKPFEGYP